MPEPKKPTNRKPAPSSAWWQPSVDIESLSPDQRLAHEVVVRRRDLTPSVERIMTADLDPSQRSVALTAFSNALDSPGDPNRDPRVAIENASSGAVSS
jgi:hypothetical protein